MEMETHIDFLQCLEIDMALKILMCLDDSADLIRSSAVSRYWQNFVITNGLCKQLCTRTFPQLATIDHIVEPSGNSISALDDPSSKDIELEALKRDHRAYASLFRALTTFPQSYCIASPVSASTTDNYPEESIMNTLDPREASYWSSKGCENPEAPETLIYNLGATFCVITEINVQPFQALFQSGFPIYSSKFVRFRTGHHKSWGAVERDFLELQESADDKFVWTYTSQMFPMVQESRLQRFKLPEPVLCIGGFLQIEFLGRVQKQQADDKYYICVAHVQAIGQRLSPAFSFEFREPPFTVSLKYDCVEFKRKLQIISDGNNGSFSTNLHQNGVEYEWVDGDEFVVIVDDDGEINPMFII